MIPLAIRYWRIILGGAVVLILVIMLGLAKADARHWRKKADNLTAQIAEYKAAEAQAIIAAKQKETRDAQATVAAADAYDNLRARYVAAVNRLRTKSTAPGSVSETPDTAETTDGAGQGSLIPVPTGDLTICAENTAKAETWQAWWKSVQ